MIECAKFHRGNDCISGTGPGGYPGVCGSSASDTMDEDEALEAVMSEIGDEVDVELPGRGDDRPGLDDLEAIVELVVDDFDEVEDDLDEDDYPDDAGEEDIDLIVALYREEGAPLAVALDLELANDLDELINQLRRIPGDAGAVGVVSIASEFFAIVRVRGKHVQVMLSDAVSANDWPLARDIADFLGGELADEDDDSYPIGDLDILADAGLSDFELEAIASEDDEDTALLLEQIAEKVKFGPQFKKVVEATFE